MANVPARIRRRRVGTSGSSPSIKYFSISSSSISTATSIILARHSSACSFRLSRIGRFSQLAPRSSPAQTHSSMVTRSIMPSSSFSAPIGICIGQGVAPVRSLIIWTQLKKSAPILSILFTNTIRGTLYRSAWRHTVSVCGSTPAFASRTATAPSRTASDLSTSIVKSTCPGVSMMFIRCLGVSAVDPSSVRSQNVVVAAEVIVIPRSCSCSIQSIVAAPSCTSPMLWDLPV